jgi:uncharacterized protein
MPINTQIDYHPPFPFRNAHFNTIYPSLFRRVNGITFSRERIQTPDNDFLDVDFILNGNKKLMVLIHGLEGSTQSSYIKGIAKHASEKGYDIAAINMRGCSGESNLLLSSYHSGKSDDLDLVLKFLISKHQHQEIFITGFSMGGNIALKYAGEKGKNIPSSIAAIAAVSVPCDLKSCAIQLSKFSNRIYLNRFLKSLKSKALEKLKLFPDADFKVEQINNVKNFHDFDSIYTAPVNGYSSAEDYWSKNSCMSFLPDIYVPALIINASDDPFLGPDCYPVSIAKGQKVIHLEIPRYGGHTGFSTKFDFSDMQWHEKRILSFFSVLSD